MTSQIDIDQNGAVVTVRIPEDIPLKDNLKVLTERFLRRKPVPDFPPLPPDLSTDDALAKLPSPQPIEPPGPGEYDIHFLFGGEYPHFKLTAHFENLRDASLFIQQVQALQHG